MQPSCLAGLDRLALAHALTDGCDDVRRMPLSVSLSLLRLSRHCPSLATRLRPVLEHKLSLLLPKLPPSTRARVIRDMAATPIVLRTQPPLGAELSGAAAAGCCRGAGVSDAGRARREHGGGAATRGAGARGAAGAGREPEGPARPQRLGALAPRRKHCSGRAVVRELRRHEAAVLRTVRPSVRGDAGRDAAHRARQPAEAGGGAGADPGRV